MTPRDLDPDFEPLDDPLDFESDGLVDDRPEELELLFACDDGCPELEWLLPSCDFELELEACLCLCLSSRRLSLELESPVLESGVFEDEEDPLCEPEPEVPDERDLDESFLGSWDFEEDELPCDPKDEPEPELDPVFDGSFFESDDLEEEEDDGL